MTHLCPVAGMVFVSREISALHTMQRTTSSWLPSVVQVAAILFSIVAVPPVCPVGGITVSSVFASQREQCLLLLPFSVQVAGLSSVKSTA